MVLVVATRYRLAQAFGVEIDARQTLIDAAGIAEDVIVPCRVPSFARSSIP